MDTNPYSLMTSSKSIYTGKVLSKAHRNMEKSGIWSLNFQLLGENLTQKMQQQGFLSSCWRRENHSTHTMSSAARITFYLLLKVSAECLKTHWNTQKWMTQLQRSEWCNDKQSLWFKFKRAALQVSVQHLCDKLVVSVACTNKFFFFLVSIFQLKTNRAMMLKR